jgi:uncharacterized protein YndB with AHSA1/START domain
MMEFSVHLPLPRERVWHYLYGDKMRHVPEVAPSIVEIRDYRMRDDGTPEYVMVHQNGPMRFSERSDYFRYEPPERAENWVRDSALGGVYTIELGEEADGTRMTHRWDIQARNPVLQRFTPLIARMIQRAQERQADTMVERLVHHDRYCTVGDHR